VSDESLREPEPERLSDLDRRMRERDRRVPWVRILILALSLVAIIAFHQSISEGVAGCYGKYVQPGTTSKSPSPPGQAQPGEMNLRIEPARPLAPPAPAAPSTGPDATD
jgi:hypothetical protein